MAFPVAAAGPTVTVVLGPEAPALEKFAAQELSGQFKRLFAADVKITDKADAKAEHVILLGSPATNPHIKTLIGEQWPKLTDQGHLVKSYSHDDRKFLVVGGGSPVATLWAVYELGYRFGIRYLLSGDVLPCEPARLKLDGFDVLLEPNLRLRIWRTLGDSAAGAESLGLAEQKRVLAQVAKQKFNRVLLTMYPAQPFVDFEYKGVKKSSAVLAEGLALPVDGDSAGRNAFREAKEFGNPDFLGKKTYQERTAVGIALARGILDTAKQLGMSTAIGVAPLAFPKEFGDVLRNEPANATPRLAAQTIIRAYLSTYPQLDSLYLSLQAVDEKHSDDPGTAFLLALPNDRELFQRPSGGKVEVAVNFLQIGWLTGNGAMKALEKTKVLVFGDVTARRTALSKLFEKAPSYASRCSLILPLADTSVGVLPQINVNSLHTLVDQLRKQGWEGFSVTYGILGDLDPSVHYLSRASFDPKLTVKQSYDDLITPICGAGVAERQILCFEMMEKACALLDANASDFARPSPSMLMQHFTDKPVPAWIKEASKIIAGAMDEDYRAWTRSHQNGRTFLLYHAKRQEFAIEYLGCLENLHAAGQAKAKGDNAKVLEILQKAEEGLHNGINALSEAAHDDADRGLIAVLNAYAFRPLKKEVEAREKAGE